MQCKWVCNFERFKSAQVLIFKNKVNFPKNRRFCRNAPLAWQMNNFQTRSNSHLKLSQSIQDGSIWILEDINSIRPPEYNKNKKNWNNQTENKKSYCKRLTVNVLSSTIRHAERASST